MHNISVLTPTVRPEGLKIVANSLAKQLFIDWEWLICAPKKLEEEIHNILKDTVPYVFLGNKPLRPGQFWDLNYSYNRLFKQANSELCVSWQDWIYVPPDGLEKFWLAYKQTKGQALITGVGDQFEQLDGRDKPYIKIWHDPRKTTKYGSFYECTFPDMEWNFGAIPKALFDKAGGLDEELDFRGYDGATYQLDERLNEMGYKFYIDQANESYTIQHDRSAHGGEENWNKNHTMFNGQYQKRKEELKRLNQWPVLIDKH